MAEINRKTKSSGFARLLREPLHEVNIFDRTLNIIERDHAEPLG